MHWVKVLDATTSDLISFTYTAVDGLLFGDVVQLNCSECRVENMHGNWNNRDPMGIPLEWE